VAWGAWFDCEPRVREWKGPFELGLGVIDGKSPEVESPGTVAQRIQNEITFGSRLVNTPEFRFNVFQKYTFTDNFIGEHGRGFSVGLGTRYSSEINIQNNVNMWTARGGLAAGDYVGFDTT